MMSGDLEDGEIEDGEIPEEGSTQMVEASPEDKPQAIIAPSNVPNESEGVVKPEAQLAKVKRTGGVANQRRNEVKAGGTPEDDWAGEVEKAIKAALGDKNKGESSGGNFVEGNGDNGGRLQHKKRKKEKEDNENGREKKKKKWGHVVPSEEAAEVGQLASSGQEEEDDDYDDEMLFVRGASPIMPSGYGSPHGFRDESPQSFMEGGPFDESYDSDYEQEEFMRAHDEGGLKRGRGGKPLRGRGGGRGLMKKRQQMGLKKAIGNLGKRLGNKRQVQRLGKPPQGPQQTSESICAFFMQGKCQKENECPYSHNALPPRKMELCKFYLMGCCAKKDKCLYMHSDFPCKFFHSGLKCNAGNRCKFSHGNLTEPLKEILLKHLETAPKEILGDFPRERAAAMIYNKNCSNKGPWPGAKKIPSLLEIEVPIPPQLLAGNPELRRDEEKSMRHSTPMPNSDSEDKDGCLIPNSSSPNMGGRGSMRQWDGDDSARPGDSGDEEMRHKGFHKMFRGRMPPNRELSEERETPRRPNYQDQDFTEQLQQLKMLFKKESLNSADEADGGVETQHQRKHHKHSKKKKKKSRDEEQGKSSSSEKQHTKTSPPASHMYPEERLESSMLENKASDGEAADMTDEEGKLEIDVQHEDEGVEEEQEDKRSFTPPLQSDTSSAKVLGDETEDTDKDTSKDHGETDNNSSSCSLEMGGIPLNLPKKQRELFLRIQQQQREAASLISQEDSAKDEDRDSEAEPQEESWYSSDEEEASLADVLKKISNPESQQQQQPPQQEVRHPSPSTTPPLPPPKPAVSLDGIKLSDISISEPVSKLLSIIRLQQTTSAATTAKTVETAESRAQVAKEPSTPVRDPRLAGSDHHRRSSSVSSMSPNPHESPRQDPRISKRSSTKGPAHRTSIYSSAIVSSSINIIPSNIDSGSEVETKNFQQHSNPLFSNLDPRTNRASTSSLPYAYGDLEAAGNIDLKGPLGLPFKPVPMHKPATEIDASLSSHPPIPYKVVPITIPWPDYSRLKLNVSDVQIRSDPRLRKIFKMSSSSSKRQSSPPPPPPPSSPPPVPKQSPSNIARNDPRRRSAPMSPHASMSPKIQETPPMYPDMMGQNPMGLGQGPMGFPQNRGVPQNPMGMPPNPMNMPQNPMGLGPNPAGLPPNPMGLMHNPGMPAGMVPGMPYDPRLPRNPRNAPGLLGPAPLPFNYCPNTPKYEDMDEGMPSNSDPRMFYNQPPMDMQSSQSRNPNMSRNRTWKNNRKNQRRYRAQQQEQQRSFTPPL